MSKGHRAGKSKRGKYVRNGGAFGSQMSYFEKRERSEKERRRQARNAKRRAAYAKKKAESEKAKAGGE